jgi:hypothetical protein
MAPFCGRELAGGLTGRWSGRPHERAVLSAAVHGRAPLNARSLASSKMCLEIIAEIASDAPARVSPGRLSEVSGLSVTKMRRALRGALHFSGQPGCSCDLMSESADWNAATWALTPQAVRGLERAVELLIREARRFTFLAHWLGGNGPPTAVAVPAAELLRDIRQNQIRNNVVYKVGEPG